MAEQAELFLAMPAPTPASGSAARSPNQNAATDRVQTGRFLVDHGEIVAQAAPASAQKPRAPSGPGPRTTIASSVPAAAGKGQ